ncbi:MAG: amidohydrolase/deacetylase family metallohydrolase [Bacteroidales bacterium]|jgi:dihydroorotase|nr:amidohydrolase/deacetylase family metallohydrolase [Bacteroidales bacterium]
MRKKTLLIVLLCLVAPAFIFAQTYNIVIKGGHVIDPKNNIDGPMDVAVKDGKIALVAKNIDASGAVQVVDATGMYVTPGLIDNHVHVFHGPNLNNGDIMYMNGPNSVPPDGFTFRVGVTTVVDAGCAGWRSFPDFKRQVIDISQTRILAYLNIVGIGMWEGPFENNVKDMDAQRTAEFAKQNSEYIVGIKLAHFTGREPTPVIRAVEAGTIANMPVMVDHGRTQLDSLLLYYLRPGDIYSHCFTRNTGQNIPTMEAARKRGVLFEVGHGGGSFGFENAIPLSKVGFFPDVISTDLHISSMNAAMKDQLTCMDKFLALGMDLKSVINASTWKTAQMIKRPELGHLSVGSEADIAILSIRTGKFGLFDTRGVRIEADKKLECQMTIRAGRIVYDLNGIATPVMVPRRRS